MNALFASGHAADIILAILAIEAIWLAIGGRALPDIAGTLLPAVLIVLGLRAALIGADWAWIALPLAAALPVHLWDLVRRGMLRRS
ncbi:hypothetical protein HFP57_06910 [Parasphingopyxis algicola]|uniref:hypothetical protein n=1 Tax=Parasphingopyxis algicola TaxID=2026624 RepID=UPI00159F85C3|nr:hypothetical protein [Parasphingopyxis algicola]QLC24784.1 hypothetical protein HFP57_06910 [Parasphingopyxis algicola]